MRFSTMFSSNREKRGRWFGFLLCVFAVIIFPAVRAPATATGDIDGDGSVDGYDAVVILRYDVGLAELNPSQMAVADTSGDGEVDGYDAVLILRYDVGLLDHFPAESAPLPPDRIYTEIPEEDSSRAGPAVLKIKTKPDSR